MDRVICVFCGSRSGDDARYAECARLLGRLLVENNITLVYGGGNLGLMGELAKTVDEAGGKVVSIIPKPLAEYCAPLIQPHNAIITKSMHERKRLMADHASAFLALPGGIGTMEELLEMCTWNQLGIINKPIGILNVGGFWTPLLGMFERAVESSFLDEKNSGRTAGCLVGEDPRELLARVWQVVERIKDDPEKHFFGLTTWES